MEQLSAVEKDLMVLDVIDVFDLERGHADLPDDFAGGGPELNILGSDQGLRRIEGIMLLGQLLMRKIKIILVDKTSVKTFSLLIERTITIIRQNPVLKGLFHSNKLDLC